MKVAICDDEKAERELIERFLKEWASKREKNLETVCFSSGEGFWFSWEEDKAYDLLILDIELGKLNGMELAKRIRMENEEIPILFITGYDEFMAQGYEVAALHYLLKPLQKEKLFDVLERLKRMKKQEEKILFQTEEGIISLPPSKIWLIEACRHQCILCSEGREMILKESISSAEKKLEGKKGFIRCHRSYLVNLSYISAILKTEIVLDNGKRIPLSRRVSKEVNMAFIKKYQGVDFSI